MEPPAVKTQRESGDVAPCQRYKMAKLFIADTQDDGVEMLMLLHARGEIMKEQKVKLWICMACLDV